MTFLIEPLALSSLAIVGPDRRAWLDSILTADLKDLPSGSAVPAFLLTKQGKIQAEIAVFEAGDAVELGQSGGARIEEELNRYLIMEDAEIEGRPEASWFALYGDLSGLDGSRLLAPEAALLRYAPLGPRGRLLRTLSPRDEALGLALGLGGVRDEARFTAARIDSGFPLPLVDYSSEDNPHEAGLEETYVSFKKGCYLGQEVVCMQEMRGKVKRRLVRVESEGIVLPGQVVSDGSGQEIGKVTSAAGHRALARIKAPGYAPGAVVSIEGARAKVHALLPGAPWENTSSAGTLIA